MRVTGAKLAAADRRLLSSMDGQERWQQVKVPISPALWDVWGRYCEVAGISMGRGIAALIELEVGAISGGLEELEERGRLLDARAAELDEREREIDRRTRPAAPRPSKAELEAMATALEPPSLSVPVATTGQSMVAVGRNDRCPCGSGQKFKRCHGAPPAPG